MSTEASQPKSVATELVENVLARKVPFATAVKSEDKADKRRGSNLQKPRRRYRAYNSYTMSRRIKRFTETYKRYSGATRLSPEERDMVVYLSTTQHSNSSRED